MKTLRILAAIAAALLALVILTAVGYTIFVANKAGAWPLYLVLALFLVFGWDNIYGTIRALVLRALDK